MRALLIIILCIITVAPGECARRDRDDRSDQTPKAETKERSSESSSSSSASRSSESSSSHKPSDSASTSGSSYRPSNPEPTRSTPREDPPPTMVRRDAAPTPSKPAEDASHSSNSSSYRPSGKDSEPARHTPPTPSASDSASATVSTTPQANAYRPDSTYKPSGNSGATEAGSETSPSTKTPTTGTVYHPTVQTSTGDGASRRPVDTSRYSPKKEAKLEQKAAEDKAKSQQGASTKSTYRPGPTATYTPAGKTSKPGGTVNSANPATYRPATTTYKPAARSYKVGYRPTTTPVKPQSYKPPRLEEGRWHYWTPPFVEDRHYPRARFHRPCRYGHWAYDYYPGFSWRSLFFYFGVYPFVEVTRLREYPSERIEYISEPIYVSGRSYVRNVRWDRIDEALADIRSAWLFGRFDLLKQHVHPESSIAVMIDGEYDYAISSEDYLDMTEDAMADLNTISFIWNKVRERRDGTITAFADHSYWSSDRARTVYVSYTLKKSGPEYFITEIGSSMNPSTW